MRIGVFRGIAVKCSPALLILLPLSVIAGAGWEALTAFLSLTIHELCHTLVARGLGYAVSSVEIQPFGFVARLDGSLYSSADELAIAAAGPVCSFIVAFAALAAEKPAGIDSAQIEAFAGFNLTLAAVNLLPALPLDGGRIACALLSNVVRPRVAVMLSAGSGILCGLALLVLGILSIFAGVWNLSAVVMGVFLFFAAAGEFRQRQNIQLNAMMRRTARIRRGESLRLAQSAVHMSATAGEAIRLLSPERYNLLIVLDDKMNMIGQLDEGKLLSGIAIYGAQCPVGELIKRLH